MRTTRARRMELGGLAGLGLALMLLTGCQTWIGGMTLPSGHYLDQHPPQYFPPDPDFPLQKELAAQEEINALTAPGARPAIGGVNPVPPGPAVAPAPAPAPVPIMPPQN
jgi:hypothetical protein